MEPARPADKCPKEFVPGNDGGQEWAIVVDGGSFTFLGITPGVVVVACQVVGSGAGSGLCVTHIF